MKKETKIILIGGAPTTGKSFIAQKLAEDLNLPWISTDQIRTIMKSVADENKWPALFQTIPEETSPEEIINLETKGKEVIWRGVLSFIDRYYPWEGCIIEGTAVLPHFVARDLKQGDKVKSVFLVHIDNEVIANLVLERSKLPFIKTKTKIQQESKVKQIQILNERIIDEATNQGFTCITAQTKNTLEDVKKTLGNINR